MAVVDRRFRIPSLYPDFMQILKEAQSRWLQPREICEILCNYEKYKVKLNSAPAEQPESGSLHLFDRRVLRYFRKDGHNWRKKLNGRTVREAHERLKADGVEVLHCYYAHGEDNYNFQRRCYWMLDGALDHIVLVHYRDVTEGNKTSSPSASINIPASVTSPESVGVEGLGPSVPDPDFDFQAEEEFETLSGQKPSGKQYALLDQLSELHENSDLHSSEQHISAATSTKESMEPDPLTYTGSQDASRMKTENLDVNSSGSNLRLLNIGSARSGFSQLENSEVTNQEVNSPTWAEIYQQCSTSPSQQSFVNPLLSNRNLDMRNQPFLGDHLSTTLSKENALVSRIGREHNETELAARLRPVNERNSFQSSTEPVQDILPQDNLIRPHMSSTVQSEVLTVPMDQGLRISGLNENAAHLSPAVSRTPGGVQTSGAPWQNSSGNFKKLDSFDLWINSENLFTNETPFPLLGDSGSSWATNVGDGVLVKGTSSCSQDWQMDDGIPASAPKECFKIIDFSPEWVFSIVETKVIVTGTFINLVKDPSEYEWSVMFGEVEVPAALIGNGVLRCKPPQFGPGKVQLCVARSDRQACSQVLEFEYRAVSDFLNNSVYSLVNSHPETQRDDLLVQIRLFCMLTKKTHGSPVKNRPSRSGRQLENPLTELGMLEDLFLSGRKPLAEVKEELLELLLKQKLQEWLSAFTEEAESGLFFRDDPGQGVLHLAASLGYSWSIQPLIQAGIPINWRDKDGWTALHWAAYNGREKMVVALLNAGASPGAVTDPTNRSPSGFTSADLASAKGHKGISAYLAELSLTSRLSSLSTKQFALSETDTLSAVFAGEEAVAQLSRRASLQNKGGSPEEKFTIAESLKAVRHAAEAAVIIQSAFRQYLLQKKLQLQGVDEYGLSEELAETFHAAQKIQRAYRGHQQRKQNFAAFQIQHKYRAWKTRKDYLRLRQRVVKMQAAVRGRLARRRYQKILWAVNIIDKAILRWRSRRRGLQGFSADQLHTRDEMASDVESDDDLSEHLRMQSEQAVGRAVTRIRSMVPSAAARAQFQRMKEEDSKLARALSQQLRLQMSSMEVQQMDLDSESNEQGSWFEEPI